MSFLPAVNYAAGSFPFSVAVGDFKGDGHPDLAAANYDSDTVSILLGDGDGTFQAAQSYAVGIHPVSVAVGDFDGDGHLDLAVANYGSDTVSILLGNGDGTFQAAQSYPVGLFADSVAVGDFNGDGHPDLAVVSGPYLSQGAVNVLLGNGDGTFQAAQSYADVDGPRSLAVGDFDGDGHLDLAVANYGSDTVSVLLGNGDGTFQAAQNHDSGDRYASSVAVGDFNGDGHLDLAVANRFSDTVSVLLGNGDGTFQVAGSFAAGSSPWSVAVGDFDGDGHPDLAVAGGDTVSILLGNGDGTFQAAQSYAVGLFADSVAVGDFNGDGHPDLAVGNGNGNTVSVLLNAADWGGGPVPPPGGSAVQPTVHRQPHMEPAAAPLPAFKPETVSVPPLASTGLRPNSVYQWPLKMETVKSAHSEPTLSPTPVITARHAQDAVFKGWDDGFLDVLAMNLLR